MNKLEYKVPTFAPGPVKKEIMQCLRDIALDEQNIRFHEYSDGIITGCGLVEENMKIGLINGIVKFAGRLYRLKEKALVSYEPTDDWTILKLRFSPQTRHREYIMYTAELALDTNTSLLPNEMEMGRFKLKKGSSLRTSYKDFWDMNTEYDTVNLIYVNRAASFSATLCPAITIHFAREAFPCLNENPLDAAFCIACLQTRAPLSRELITRYICTRLGRSYAEMDNLALHQGLAEVLNLITGKSRSDRGRGRPLGVMLFN